jgi:thymidylate kinase
MTSIIIEGVDCAGGSTNSMALHESIKGSEHIHFPRDGCLSGMLRDEIHSEGIRKDSTKYDLLVYADLMNYKLNNVYDKDKIRIFDRHPAISGPIYSNNMILMNYLYKDFDFFDETFIFVCIPPLSTIFTRLDERKDKLDSYEKDKEFVQEIYNKYSDFTTNSRFNIYILDTRLEVDDNIKFIKQVCGVK